MNLKSIRLFQFRCYEDSTIDFDSQFNVISGMNGQGKTSILEAIFLLSTLKSFRLGKNAELIHKGREVALVSGVGEHLGLESELGLKISPKSKLSTVNGKTCRFLSEYVGKMAAVAFNPSDLEIVRGVPEYRRNWLDRIATVFDPQHIDFCSRYQRVLVQRNKELRKFSLGLIPQLEDDFYAWTEELIRLGAEVIHRRMKAVDNLGDQVRYFYEMISQTSDSLSFSYESSVFSGEDAGQGREISLESVTQSLTNSLQCVEKREKVVGSSLIGPHRDDLRMIFNGNLLKAYGSQGEVRSTILAMRLAEVQLYRETQAVDPILLIDDFSSELDSRRRNFLLDYLETVGSQVFLSTTESLSLGRVFNISEGRVAVHGH